MAVAWAAIGVVVLVALYAGYALAAGYVGALPTPLNLLAGLAVLLGAVVISRWVRRRTGEA